jgi:hypothetical protein
VNSKISCIEIHNDTARDKKALIFISLLAFQDTAVVFSFIRRLVCEWQEERNRNRKTPIDRDFTHHCYSPSDYHLKKSKVTQFQMNNERSLSA